GTANGDAKDAGDGAEAGSSGTDSSEGVSTDAGVTDGSASDDAADDRAKDPIARDHTVAAHLPGRGRRKRPATLSLAIRFESRPDDLSLARLIESTVFVNDSHPAYARAVRSRAEGYHIALSVAAALAPLTVEAADAQSFISAFLARWGEAAE